jgi:hypothetical protein
VPGGDAQDLVATIFYLRGHIHLSTLYLRRKI